MNNYNNNNYDNNSCVIIKQMPDMILRMGFSIKYLVK